MVRQALRDLTRSSVPQIAITTQAQAQYLLKALMATERLFGKDRDADADAWVREARVTLLDVIPADRARALLREIEALLEGIDTSR
jgi:hypothetical protein